MVVVACHRDRDGDVAAVYVTVGEAKPAIWLLPSLAAAFAGAGMVRLTGVRQAADHS